MSSRHSSSRGPVATPQQRRQNRDQTSSSHPAPRPLPQYSLPTAPLNASAITALENLQTRSDSVQRLKKAQQVAIDKLQDAAVVVHERSASYEEYYNKGKGQLEKLEKSLGQAQSQAQNGDDQEKTENIQQAVHNLRIRVKSRKDNAQEMRQKAEEAHTQIEAKIRKIIDGKVHIEERERVLGEVSANVQRGEGRVVPTQSTLGASQFRDQRMSDAEGDESGTQNVGNVSALRSMKFKLDESRTAYEQLNSRQRYTENNDYVGFKRLVHDAIHPEDGVTLSHPSTWFPGEEHEDHVSDPTSTMPGAFTQEEDADSDLEIARERISTKCPLTLVEMEDPVTSPCNHNFEASAIVDMIKHSNTIIGGEEEQRGRRTIIVGGERGIRCPVSSCQVKFAERQLRRDQRVRRKIKRLQEQARRQEQEGSDGDESGEDNSGRWNRAISLGSDGEESRRQSLVPVMKVKNELRSSMAPRASAIPPQSQEYSLVDADEDEEMDDEYEE